MHGWDVDMTFPLAQFEFVVTDWGRKFGGGGGVKLKADEHLCC